jgi:3-hydroxybutyryl-CoA dehydrogenase
MKFNSVVVIGAGTMGAGIAQWFAQQMIPTTLTDNNSEQTKKALTQICSSWDKLVEKEKLTSCQVNQMKQLLEARDIKALPKDTTLVIEAIIENLAIKKTLFATLDKHFSSETIFASNTSSFPITHLAQAVSPSRQARFVGLHFFNPATLMKLVEVIKGQATQPGPAEELYNWFAEQKKEPALCADTPGFIVNRVARSFYGEALRIVENENEAHCKEVDFLMREVGGFKMGPFELMDLIGVDINYSVTCSVWEALGKNARFTPHHLQKKMVDLGRFGKKTKRGFYSYE